MISADALFRYLSARAVAIAIMGTTRKQSEYGRIVIRYEHDTRDARLSAAFV
jgi:hypothetical protein